MQVNKQEEDKKIKKFKKSCSELNSKFKFNRIDSRFLQSVQVCLNNIISIAASEEKVKLYIPLIERYSD